MLVLTIPAQPLGPRALVESLLVLGCLAAILVHMLLRRHFEDLPGYGALVLLLLFSYRFAQALGRRSRITLDPQHLRHRRRQLPTASIRRVVVVQSPADPAQPVVYDLAVLQVEEGRPVRLRLGLPTEEQAAALAARLNQALEELRA